MCLDPWDQGRSQLLVQQLCLLLHQRGYGFLHLFLDDLWKGRFDGLGDCLLHLDLQVFLCLDLLLQAVHLHVQLSEFLVQLLDCHARFARGHRQLDIGGILADCHIQSLDLHLENVADEREAARPRLRVLHI